MSNNPFSHLSEPVQVHRNRRTGEELVSRSALEAAQAENAELRRRLAEKEADSGDDRQTGDPDDPGNEGDTDGPKGPKRGKKGKNGDGENPKDTTPSRDEPKEAAAAPAALADNGYWENVRKTAAKIVEAGKMIRT